MTQEHISGILLLLLSLLLLCYPKQIWKWTEAWKTKKSETAACSNAYAIVLRGVGAVLLIASCLVLFQF